MNLKVVGFCDNENVIELCVLEYLDSYTIAWGQLDEDLQYATITNGPQTFSWNELLLAVQAAYWECSQLRINSKIPSLPELLQVPYWLPRIASSRNTLHTNAQRDLDRFILSTDSPRCLVSKIENSAELVSIGAAAVLKKNDDHQWELSNPSGGLAILTAHEILKLFLALLIDEKATQYFEPLCSGAIGKKLPMLIQGLLEQWENFEDSEASKTFEPTVISDPPLDNFVEEVVKVEIKESRVETAERQIEVTPVDSEVVKTKEKTTVDFTYDEEAWIEECKTPTSVDLLTHFDDLVQGIREEFSCNIS